MRGDPAAYCTRVSRAKCKQAPRLRRRKLERLCAAELWDVDVFNARDKTAAELAPCCYQHEASGFLQRDVVKPLIQTRPPLAATGSTRLQEAVGLSAMNPPHTHSHNQAGWRPALFNTPHTQRGDWEQVPRLHYQTWTETEIDFKT